MQSTVGVFYPLSPPSYDTGNAAILLLPCSKKVAKMCSKKHGEAGGLNR